MWKSAYVGVYQLLNWKMHGETLENELCLFAWYWVKIIKNEKYSRSWSMKIQRERDVMWRCGCSVLYIQGTVECLKITPRVDKIGM